MSDSDRGINGWQYHLRLCLKGGYTFGGGDNRQGQPWSHMEDLLAFRTGLCETGGGVKSNGNSVIT